MTRLEIAQRIQQSLAMLNKEQQLSLLEYIETLISKTKVKNTANPLLQFAGSIPKDDVALMQKAIEEGCENIDENEW